MLFLASLRLDRLRDSLPAPTSGLEVAFVPTAALGESDGPWPWVEDDRAFFQDLGYGVTDLELSALPAKADSGILRDYQHVHITGGNTFFLLQEVRRCGFGEILTRFIESGGTYSGGSAGAVLLSQDVDWVAPFDNRDAAPELLSTQGLGLVNFDPLVHWDGAISNLQDEIYWGLRAKGRRPVPLRDEEAVVIDGTGQRIVHVDGSTRPV